MVYKIENNVLSAEINDVGAELYSLKSKIKGTEYVWQGDPDFWKSRSPILFPICGRLFGGKYTYCGKEYFMPTHGIVRTREFKAEIKSEISVVFTLVSDIETKKQYPFDFEFSVRYDLKENGLEITYSVKNTDKNEMSFSFGAHPAFNVPFDSRDTFEDYYVEFNENELEKIVMSENCLYSGKTERYHLKDKKIKLTHDLFDNDALFFVTNTDSVRLKSEKRREYIEISYNDMSCLGLWHKPKSVAPFICIEPWHGIPSDEGKTDDLNTKRRTIKIKPGSSYKNTYTVRIFG